MSDQEFQAALSAVIQPLVDQVGKGVNVSFAPTAPAEVSFVVVPTPPTV